MPESASLSPSDASRRGSSLVAWFADRKVNTKIMLAVGVVLGLSVLLGVVALSRLSSLSASTRDVYEAGLVPLDRIHRVTETFQKACMDVLNHGVSRTKAQKDKYRSALDEDFASLAKALDLFGQNTSAPDELRQLRATLGDYQKVVPQLLAASNRNDLAEISRIRDEVTAPLATKAGAQAESIIEKETADAQQRMASAAATYSSARTTALTMLVLAIVLGLGAAVVVARSIVAAVRKVSYVVEGLAAGDLTRSANIDARDELGVMARALDAATASVREAVKAVAASAHTLGGSSEELSSVSAQISSSAEEASVQANVVSAAAEQVSRNVQTVAAGAEQMGASIREIAHNASSAAEVAGNAVTAAATANDTVAKLGESSVEIGNVVKMITPIAEQTNLLALNATIEAARAGGRPERGSRSSRTRSRTWRTRPRRRRRTSRGASAASRPTPPRRWTPSPTSPTSSARSTATPRRSPRPSRSRPRRRTR